MPDPPSTTATLRPARLEDAAAIAEIYNDAVLTTTATFDLEPQSVEQRCEWLAARDERHPVLVAEVGGRVVGWASLSRWSPRPAYDQTVESSFYVADGFRGRGIGRLLKQALIDEARRLGYHTLIAQAASESQASLHLNREMGFEYLGTLKEVGFKFGRWLDVHIFQLLLEPKERDVKAEPEPRPAPPPASD